MGKKVALVVAIMALLLVAAGLLYWRVVHPGPGIAVWPANPVAPAPAGPERGFGNAEPGTPTAAPSVETNEKKGRTHAEPGFTLRPGESLEFAANVTKLNSTIANLKIVTAERRNFYGKNSWHLQAFARTENPYRMVFELDDQFDSYSEAGNFASQQYEMHLSERGQKVDSVDPLGLLQYLRGIDWDKTPEINSPVYDGRKFYEVRAVLLSKAEAVNVPAGNYTATKIAIHVYEGGAEMKDAHFLLYLSNDAARLPVLLEAVLPVATARVELTKAK